MSIILQFVCPQERKAIGMLEVEPGETITDDLIREHLDAAPGKRDEAAELRSAVRDRSYPQCPTCAAMLVLGLEGASVEDVVADNFLVLVGSARYPDRGAR
jgi:hypothetical protein